MITWSISMGTNSFPSTSTYWWMTSLLSNKPFFLKAYCKLITNHQLDRHDPISTIPNSQLTIDQPFNPWWNSNSLIKRSASTQVWHQPRESQRPRQGRGSRIVKMWRAGRRSNHRQLPWEIAMGWLTMPPQRTPKGVAAEFLFRRFDIWRIWDLTERWWKMPADTS